MTFAAEIWAALGGDAGTLDRLNFAGEGALPSAFRVTDLAAGAVGTAGLALSELAFLETAKRFAVNVDRRRASFWFGFTIHPQGWAMPGPWDSIAGDYKTADGWIRLHTNAPHHKAAALSVLKTAEDRNAVAGAVASWRAAELEAAVVGAGGCAAEMRALDAWRVHPQGKAVDAEPLVAVGKRQATRPSSWRSTPGRPLAGLRVLDLTRVLAGPVATRFLAGYGAEVLRIDPPGWDEPGVIPEVTLGKNCARLDLHDEGDRETFERLLRRADVLVHGYRPGALDGLGFGEAARQALRPDLIEVSLSAYGWNGPWAGRRGFDSLVQMSAGIAEAGLRWKTSDKPVPLPVQALDHATGYMMAAAAIRALTRRLTGEGVVSSRLSLARTAALLTDAGGLEPDAALAAETEADLADTIEQTDWGGARRTKPPLSVEGAPMHWDLPARALGSAKPEWRSGA